MAGLTDGTPFLNDMVMELDGERYHVLTPQDAQGVPRARAWEVERIPAQNANPAQEGELPILSFHDGGGFTYAGMPNVYQVSNGWDASAPGKLTTWARHAVGDDFDSDSNYRGWAVFHAGRLYVLRGRYAYWYAIDTDHGVEWVDTQSKDFGEGKVVCGEPAIFKGILYVPVADASTGNDEKFWQLTSVGSPDTWTQATATGLEARTFKTWHNQKTGFPVLVKATGNTLATVSDNPMDGADWGADTLIDDMGVGDSGSIITGFSTWRDSLLIHKQDGLFSINQIEVATNELPDLAATEDDFNGVGAAQSNAWILIPSNSGLIRWQPNAYHFVGPNQEGALEGDVTEGWGRVVHVTPWGKMAWLSVADTENEVASIWALEPPRGRRGPLTPHCFHMDEEGYYEGMCVVQDANNVNSYLCAVWADGTTTRPHIWQLPRYDYNPGGDPTITKARDSASFVTPRYFQPGREIQKSYRTLEFWMESSPSTGTPGLQVWASVDGDTAFQLLDDAGSAATFTGTGFRQAFFPKTQAAVGTFVELEFRIPAKGDGEVDVAVTLRDFVLRMDMDPLMTDVIRTTIICQQGEHEDRTSSRASGRTMLDRLIALAEPQADAVPFKSPWGDTGYVKVAEASYREVTYKGHSQSVWAVDLVLRVRQYA